MMKRVMLGWAGAAAVFVAGCATVGGAIDTAAAKQLAADLNAIKAGSAKVDGATVTLTDNARLENAALTVPEGVTLDLTAEGAALELRDGAVLTVDGTVNALGHGDHGKGWVEGSLRMGNGAAVINGSGTIRLASKGRLLNIWGGDGKRHLTLDGVTLAGLPDNDAPLAEVSEGGELVMKSGAITGNTRISDDWASGGGVNMYKGTFSMEGGEISGNAANGKDGAGGGGVQVGEASVFTMTGGTITGNSAQGGKNGNGGGVRLEKGATFIMEGGTITDNSAEGGENAEGGGVKLEEGATFTMTGGAISDNIATSDGETGGGGVGVGKESVFTMEDGTISGNSTNGKRNTRGGGVRVSNSGTFAMTGGTISGNSTNGDEYGSNGGGVSVGGEGSAFTMSGGTISGNSSTGGKWGRGGGVDVDLSGTFTMEGGTIYGNSTTPTIEKGEGGGVSVFSKATFTMQGGTIYGSAAIDTSTGANANKTKDDRSAALYVSKGTADGIFVGLPTAQYGKSGSLKPFGPSVADGGLTDGKTNRTLRVDPETGVLTVTPGN
jgi:hypothetical protein